MTQPEVLAVAPPEIRIDDLMSGGEFVKHRRLVEILPDSQSSFGPSGNLRATFNISANDNQFLDSVNSYFRCNLILATTADERAILDVGGIHAFIKSVTIQTKNGVRIEYIDNYNKLYAMLRCATMSENNVNSVHSLECGDSVAALPYLDPDNIHKDVSTAKFTLDSITAGSIQLREPARSRFQTERQVTFKLASDFLSHLKYIPLPMLQGGLQIIFEFERAGLAYQVVRTGAVAAQLTSVMNYTISNFRYVANMVEVSDKVMADFESVYRGPGINLPFQSYRNFRYALSGGGNFEIQFGCNSARFLLMAIMPDGSFSESAAANNEHKGLPSQSTFLKSGLVSYSVQSAGKLFPGNAPIRTNTPYAAEAFTQLMIALNQHQNLLCDTSIKTWEWADDVTKTYSRTSGAEVLDVVDSTKFIIGVDLTDIDTFSGQSTVGSNLVVDLDFGAQPAHVLGRNANCYVCYDANMTLQKDLGCIVRF